MLTPAATINRQRRAAAAITEIEAVQMRGQLNGLKDLIDAVQSVTSAQVDATTTLNPGDAASVQTNFDGASVRLNFGIPRGNDGTAGSNDGGTGGQGQPGEVSNAQLSGAISGTSNNSNGVNPLNMAVSDPPTQGEMQAIATKLDELINALRR